MYKFPIIIEEAEGNYSAYLFHLEGLKKEGIKIPAPSATVKYLEISI